MAAALAELLVKARKNASQTVKGISLLLNISLDEYEAYERGKTPNEETLKQICALFEWNYLDISKGVLSQSAQSVWEGRGEPSTGITREKNPSAIPRSQGFTQLFREAFADSGATLDGLAMILNVDPEVIVDLENGMMPNEQLLRTLATVFEWNYNDLFDLVRKESQAGIPFAEKKISTKHPPEVEEIFNLCNQIKEKSITQKASSLKVLRIQLELVLETSKRLQN